MKILLIIAAIIAFLMGMGTYIQGSIAELQSSTNCVLIAIWLTMLASNFNSEE
jgi:hypothetical protein